jgi:hypothetical protein
LTFVDRSQVGIGEEDVSVRWLASQVEFPNSLTLGFAALAA